MHVVLLLIRLLLYFVYYLFFYTVCRLFYSGCILILSILPWFLCNILCSPWHATFKNSIMFELTHMNYPFYLRIIQNFTPLSMTNLIPVNYLWVSNWEGTSTFSRSTKSRTGRINIWSKYSTFCWSTLCCSYI